MNREVYRLENVAKFYHQDQMTTIGINKISISLYENEFVAIVGKSGSGKSTLLNVLSGLDGYEQGELYFNGEGTSSNTPEDWEHFRSNNIGFIFQSYNLIDSYTVYQNIILALETQNFPIKERRNRTIELINLVGLSHRKNSKCSKLSGGEKQRVAIARALAKDSPIIIADEPTANLDSVTGKSILKLIAEQRKNKLVILVTHDFNDVKDYCTREIVLHDGEITSDRQVNPKGDSTEMVFPVIKKLKFFDNFKIAIRNLLATPSRSLFLFLLFGILTFLLFLSYSGTVSSSRTNEQFLGKSLFNSLDEHRALITKVDDSPLNDEDYSYLNNLIGESKITKNVDFFYNNSSSYVTDFTTSIKESDLIKGRMPVTGSEIVVEDATGLILAGGPKSKDDNSTVKSGELIVGWNDNGDRYSVVGIVKISNTRKIYFSPDILLTLESRKNPSLDRIKVGVNGDIPSLSLGIVSGSLLDNNVNVPKYLSHLVGSNIRVTFDFENNTFENNYYVQGVVSSLKQFDNSQIELSSAELNKVNQQIHDIINEKGKVVSIQIDNRTSYMSLKDSLNKDKYILYYPSDSGDIVNDLINSIEIMFAIILILIIGSIASLVLYVTSKNIFKSRTKDFAIFQSLGVNKKNIIIITIIEFLLVSILGFFLVSLGCFLFVKTSPGSDIATNLSLVKIEEYAILLLIVLYISFRTIWKTLNKQFHYTIATLFSTGGDILD